MFSIFCIFLLYKLSLFSSKLSISVPPGCRSLFLRAKFTFRYRARAGWARLASPPMLSRTIIRASSAVKWITNPCYWVTPFASIEGLCITLLGALPADINSLHRSYDTFCTSECINIHSVIQSGISICFSITHFSCNLIMIVLLSSLSCIFVDRGFGIIFVSFICVLLKSNSKCLLLASAKAQLTIEIQNNDHRN